MWSVARVSRAQTPSCCEDSLRSTGPAGCPCMHLACSSEPGTGRPPCEQPTIGWATNTVLAVALYVSEDIQGYMVRCTPCHSPVRPIARDCGKHPGAMRLRWFDKSGHATSSCGILHHSRRRRWHVDVFIGWSSARGVQTPYQPTVLNN